MLDVGGFDFLFDSRWLGCFQFFIIFYTFDFIGQLLS